MTYFASQMSGQFDDLLILRENEIRQGLHQSLEQTLKDAGNPDHETGDTKDAAFTQSGLDISQARGDLQAARLADIEAARQRLAHGDFGFCVKCGASIDLARLLVIPETPRCAQCQESFERHSRRLTN